MLQDLLPLGDLGVRNGIGKHFSVKGKGKNGSLDEKKDREIMVSADTAHTRFGPFIHFFLR